MSNIHYKPDDLENVSKFMQSAKSIINYGANKPSNIVAMALNESWTNYASKVDVRALTTNTKKALSEMARKFPGFKPIKESGKDAVLPSKGKGLPQGTASGQMPAYKTGEEKELNSKNDLIKRKQKNTLDSTPEVPGTGVGMDGKSTSKIAKMEALATQDPALLENVVKLTKHIRRSLTESLNSGFKVQAFSLLVKEGKEVARTPRRQTLAEAVADAEEILLFHSPLNVKMSVEYISRIGQPGKKLLEMVTMKSRSPIFFENKTLFRFQRNAEAFARQLSHEGYASKLSEHNWGTSVMAESRKAAIAAFQKVIV